MSGHSHWAGIKHKKALVDAKRGKLWSRLAKAIIVAAKHGGGDPDANLRLRYAIDDAKAVSMPKENIQRAIKRGTGELDGGNLEEVVYEGYGSGGVAILCEVLDRQPQPHRRRDPQNLRALRRQAGRRRLRRLDVRQQGAVPRSRRRRRRRQADGAGPGGGADDVKRVEDKFEVTCDPALYRDVSKALADGGITPEASQITRIAKNTVDISEPEAAQKVLRLIERLDDHDDVQNVSSNFNIPDEVMKAIGEG